MLAAAVWRWRLKLQTSEPLAGDSAHAATWTHAVRSAAARGDVASCYGIALCSVVRCDVEPQVVVWCGAVLRCVGWCCDQKYAPRIL